MTVFFTPTGNAAMQRAIQRSQSYTPFPHPIPQGRRPSAYGKRQLENVTMCNRNVTSHVTPKRLKFNTDFSLQQCNRENEHIHTHTGNPCCNVTLLQSVYYLYISIGYLVTRNVTDVTFLFKSAKRCLKDITRNDAETPSFLKQKGTVKIKNIYGSAQRGGSLAGAFPIWVNNHADSDPLKLLQGKGFSA
jgi:hypothetical protein